jgi:type II secretory pathway component PulM
MTTLSRRDRRALWWGAALLVPLLAWRGLVAPLADAHAARDARADLAAQLLARERALLRDGARLQSALASARRALDVDAAPLLAAPDSSAAAASVARWLRDAARASQLAEVGVNVTAASAISASLLNVVAEVQCRGTTDALEGWLDRVERSARGLLVERLDVTLADDGLLTASARVRALVRAAAE